jgi:hypothetical protein
VGLWPPSQLGNAGAVVRWRIVYLEGLEVWKGRRSPLSRCERVTFWVIRRS